MDGNSIDLLMYCHVRQRSVGWVGLESSTNPESFSAFGLLWVTLVSELKLKKFQSTLLSLKWFPWLPYASPSDGPPARCYPRSG
jgi:hypothetical protein